MTRTTDGGHFGNIAYFEQLQRQVQGPLSDWFIQEWFHLENKPIQATLLYPEDVRLIKELARSQHMIDEYRKGKP